MTEDYKQMKKEIEKFVKEHKKALEEAIAESFTLECKKINELEKERDKLKKKLGTKEVQLANAEFDLHFEEMKTRELEQTNKELVEDNLNFYKENEKLKENAQDTYDMYKALIESFEISNNERSKYRSALEEIKGTVQKGMCSLKKGYSREYQDTLSNIFNKINEVLQ